MRVKHNERKGKRVGIFIPSFRGGGAEKVLLTLANNLCDKDFQVLVIVGECKGPYAKMLDDSVRVICLKQSNVRRCVLPIRSILSREKLDVIITTMLHCNVCVCLAGLLSFSGVKIILRDALLLSIEKKEFNYIFMLVRLLYRRADALVFTSEAQYQDFSQYINAGSQVIIHVIPNAISKPDLDHSMVSATSTELKIKYGRYVISAGRLTAQKGFAKLIQAFGRVLDHYQSELKLIILGEGEDRGKLEALVTKLGLESDIVMPGFVSNPIDYMAASEVYVLSSEYEGMPNVLLQAVGVGVKVVSVDCKCGPAEILADVDGALLVDGTVAGICRGIQESLMYLGPVGPSEVWYEKYGLEKNVESYRSLIGRLVGDDV